MVGWANSCPRCLDRLRRPYSHLVGGSFLAGNAAWTLSGCMTTESADYCILINEWAWLRSQVCLLRLKVETGFSYVVRAWTEIEIRCIKGMYRLKVVSSEKQLGFKGFFNPALVIVPCYTCLMFTGLSIIQFLIVCTMQK